jgi:hypothetical protein
MITLEEYIGPHAQSPDWTPVRENYAVALLVCCADLEAEMIDDGVEFPDNPATGSGVSGQTFGGFRPQSCPQGAVNSSHKEGCGVDRYDPRGHIDTWCFKHQDRLAAHGIYIEAPVSTPGWSHWTTRAPRSGNRVFMP